MNYKSRSVLRSTDFNIRKDFLSLCDRFSDLEFYYPKSLIHDFFHYAGNLFVQHWGK